jgi:long-chain fatty acid transport protein
MRKTVFSCASSSLLCLFVVANVAHAGPYPAMTGTSTAADDANVAGNNPAAMTLLDSRQYRAGVFTFISDSTFEGQVGDNGPEFSSQSDGVTAIPSFSFVQPFKDDWRFGFTFVGMGFSEDYGEDWAARYLIQDYTLLYITAFPSIAKKVTDKLSLGGSLMLTYTKLEQSKAVLNLPLGSDDGEMFLDADGTTLGFSASMLYEFNDQTRFGAVYRSELDPELDGGLEFSGLTPTTEDLLQASGVLDAQVTASSRSPQSANIGIYHEFGDTSVITVDAVWVDFSEFTLTELYLDGDRLTQTNPIYEDVFAFSIGYHMPLSEKLRIGFGAFYASDMVKDENRTVLLRLDDVWSAGVGLEWQWTDTRTVNVSLNYMQIGEAPTTSPEIPGYGSISGKYTERGIVFIEAALSWGSSGK